MLVTQTQINVADKKGGGMKQRMFSMQKKKQIKNKADELGEKHESQITRNIEKLYL